MIRFSLGNCGTFVLHGSELIFTMDHYSVTCAGTPMNIVRYATSRSLRARSSIFDLSNRITIITIHLDHDLHSIDY